MDELKLHTPDLAEENFRRLAEMFPNAVTETITGYITDENGEKRAVIRRAVDADVLRQEISAEVVEGPQERYQFTWPDKRRAVALANAPVTKTLRLDRDRSVGRDGVRGSVDTGNIYIEGDNLDALKLLRETYLGKVKLIYIDPPYNTGSDFIYADAFARTEGEYLPDSGQWDEAGNRLVQNTERNGRFHTDWLNMLYPRLRLAKDLLSDDGVIFISIDDGEVSNLRKMCAEIFGAPNFIAQINWKGRGGKQDSKYYAVIHEYILVYAKNARLFEAGEEIKSGDVFPYLDEKRQRYYKTQLLRKWGSNSRREDRPNLFYPITAPDGSELYPMLSASECGRWRWGRETMLEAISEGRVEFMRKDGEWVAYEKIYAPLEGEEKTKKYITWIDDVSNGTSEIKALFGRIVFDYAKSPELIGRFIKMANVSESQIVLDFFSGSATTAHAVMQLNAEDGGNRRFILVQLPELCDERSEAYRAGYATICEIGQERIRRAGQKIVEDSKFIRIDVDKDKLMQRSLNADGTFDDKYAYKITPSLKEEKRKKLDVGFRVFRVDSSNMEDVYYRPAEYDQTQLNLLTDNIKPDRTAEDLLFQVMLELGIELSSPIKETVIAGKKVFDLAEGYLLACFDSGVTEAVVTEIARRSPFYAVFRDSSMASDSVAANFEQIFETYSPKTVRKVL